MSIVERLQQHTPATVESRPLSEADRKAIHRHKFEEALVAFICCVHIAFSIVENEFFIAVLAAASNLVPHILPSSHNTVRDWTIRSYHKRKARVKNLLQKALSNIHLSFDLWTSNNHYAFNAALAVSSSHLIVVVDEMKLDSR
jgi:hypothetical protein